MSSKPRVQSSRKEVGAPMATAAESQERQGQRVGYWPRESGLRVVQGNFRAVMGLNAQLSL